MADAIRRGRLLWLLMPLLLGALAAPASALTLPPGFQVRVLPLPKASGPTYTNGLQKPSTLEFAPDGTMFVAERNGRVLAFDSIEDSTPTLVANIINEVHADGDRGILGMKLAPGYPADPYIYLSYTYDAPIGGDSADSPHPHLADGSDGCETSSDSGCLVSGRLVRIEVNPTTDVAVGGAQEPPQEVLINSWCQQKLSHSIGDIEFDSSGALLMTGGDGASWSIPDYGQEENPCEDPPNEGGSLRSQDVRTPQTASDPTDYSGSLIRVDPDTAAALPDNPFSVTPLKNAQNEVDNNAARILAYGMRNPFRFAIKPGTDDVYIGDVGWDQWEEIDHATSPPAAGQKAVNFGWPCYEGGPSGNLVNSRWDAIDKPLCESLYAEPNAVRAPVFAYPHPFTPGYDGHLFPGDACNPAAGSSVAGLFFYDPTGVDPSALLPEKYQGALFFTDASRGCIWTMEEGADGQPDPSTIENFIVHENGDTLFTPVDIVQGPDGALYVPNFYFDEIWQIRYFPGNAAPTLDLDVDKTYGELPLQVHFDASGSSDPDPGDQLEWAWDLNGDGEFSEYGSASTASHEYSDPVNVTAAVRIRDEFSHVVTKTVDLYPGDKGPPTGVAIAKPTSDLKWIVGQPFDYEGTVSGPDPDGESLGSGLTPHWEFRLKHCPDACHEHPLISSDTAAGSFAPEEHEFPSHLRLVFTVTDSRGMSASAEVEVDPLVIEIGVKSDPAGIPLALNGFTDTALIRTEAMAGGKVNVAAPATVEVDGQPYVFDSWSDGGARIHDATSLETVDLVAHFVPEPDEPDEEPEEPEEPKEEPKPSSGGGSASPPVEPPATPPALARLRLTSRPPGARLRLGAVRAAAPFSAELLPGTESFLLAPRAIRRHGKQFLFQRWAVDGKSLGKSRRQALTISGDARYLAIYGRR